MYNAQAIVVSGLQQSQLSPFLGGHSSNSQYLGERGEQAEELGQSQIQRPWQQETNCIFNCHVLMCMVDIIMQVGTVTDFSLTQPRHRYVFVSDDLDLCNHILVTTGVMKGTEVQTLSVCTCVKMCITTMKR